MSLYFLIFLCPLPHQVLGYTASVFLLSRPDEFPHNDLSCLFIPVSFSFLNQPISRLLFERGSHLDKISSSPSIPFYSKNLPLRTAGSSRPRLSLDTEAVRKPKTKMQPALGALGHTWTAMRAMEFISLITIIGLTGNFIGEMVNADYAAPSALIGTLIVVSILFYCVVAWTLTYTP